MLGTSAPLQIYQIFGHFNWDESSHFGCVSVSFCPMTRFILFALITLHSCTSTPQNEEKPLEPKKEHRDTLSRYIPIGVPEDPDDVFDCDTKSFDFESGEIFFAEECHDEKKKRASHRLIHLAEKIPDTLELTEELSPYFDAETPLMPLKIEKIGTHFLVHYFFMSCAGQECRTELRMEFELNAEGEIVFLEAYRFEVVEKLRTE